MSNLLDPSALIAKLPTLLPSDTKELKSTQDGLAALVHTVLTILGFRLIGVDDSSTNTIFESNVLPSEWNSHGPGAYTFRYKHEQSSFEFIIKVAKLGGRTMINAIAAEVCYPCILRGHKFLYMCIVRQSCLFGCRNQRLHITFVLSPQRRRCGRVTVGSWLHILQPNHRLYIAVSVDDCAKAHPWAAQRRLHGTSYDVRTSPQRSGCFTPTAASRSSS